jgi:hypothetical protein
LGDEAVHWANYGPKGASSISVRSGRIIVAISGPTLADATAFAATFVDALNAGNKSVESGKE